MSDRPKIFDDLAGLAGGAISAVSGLRDEVEAMVRARLDEAVRRMELVRKDEVEALADMLAATNARLEAAEARIAVLEALPAPRRAALYELLALANERLWIGHFGMESEDGMPLFRHAVLLRGAPGVSAESLEDMVDIAITECERFYPAFQFVLWGGKTPAEALQAAMLECAGEA